MTVVRRPASIWPPASLGQMLHRPRFWQSDAEWRRCVSTADGRDVRRAPIRHGPCRHLQPHCIHSLMRIRTHAPHRRLPAIQRAVLIGLSSAYGAAARTYARCVVGSRAPIPVVCVGSVLAGGSGKTPVAHAIVRFVTALVNARESEGIAGEKDWAVSTQKVTQGPTELTDQCPHVICRGYGGYEVGPLRVNTAAHDARRVGDEPLLHAAVGPTWVSRSRLAGVRAAAAAGGAIAVLDDGLQHFQLLPDFSLLVLRTPSASALGNGRTLPAGPLREHPAEALRRADAIVILSDCPLCDTGCENGTTHTGSRAYTGADAPTEAHAGDAQAGFRSGASHGHAAGGGMQYTPPSSAPPPSASTPSSTMAAKLPLRPRLLPAALDELTTSGSPSTDARALERRLLRLATSGSHDGRGSGGNGRSAAHPHVPDVLHAALLPTAASIAALSDLAVIGFSASASPESFARTLEHVVTGCGHAAKVARGECGQLGREVDGRRGGRVLALYAYPDHAHIADSELQWLLAQAQQHGAVLVATSKDRVRLPAWARPQVLELEVCVKWERASATRLAALLSERVLNSSRRATGS